MRSRIQRWQGPRQRLDDLMVLAELASEEQSDSVLSEIESEAAELSKDIEKLQLQTLLSGEYDRNGAILSIHPGQAGLSPKTGLRCCCACTRYQSSPDMR